jgi:transcriptional regulator with XRE-family HTH domain
MSEYGTEGQHAHMLRDVAFPVNTRRSGKFATLRFMEVDCTPGDRLREARRALKLSAGDVGARLGMSGGNVRHYESGRNVMDMDMAEKFAQIVKRSAQLIINGKMTYKIEIDEEEYSLLMAYRTTPEAQKKLIRGVAEAIKVGSQQVIS